VPKDASKWQDESEKVVIVAGSSRMSKILTPVREFHNVKKLPNDVNRDETIAYGPAMAAAPLAGNENLEKRLLLHLNPLSLRPDRVNGYISVLIPRNARISFIGSRN
jgi:molecular chaperone DnaK (HSP70)